MIKKLLHGLTCVVVNTPGILREIMSAHWQRSLHGPSGFRRTCPQGFLSPLLVLGVHGLVFKKDPTAVLLYYRCVTASMSSSRVLYECMWGLSYGLSLNGYKGPDIMCVYIIYIYVSICIYIYMHVCKHISYCNTRPHIMFTHVGNIGQLSNWSTVISAQSHVSARSGPSIWEHREGFTRCTLTSSCSNPQPGLSLNSSICLSGPKPNLPSEDNRLYQARTYRRLPLSMQICIFHARLLDCLPTSPSE